MNKQPSGRALRRRLFEQTAPHFPSPRKASPRATNSTHISNSHLPVSLSLFPDLLAHCDPFQSAALLAGANAASSSSIFILPTTLPLMPLWLLLSLLHFARGCSPPPPSPFNNQQQHQGISTRQATQQGVAGVVVAGIDKASALSGPVREPEELYCYDFDDKCRWRNMEGLLVDELDWYQGAGSLDENRLRLATGTHLSPEGFYGIAATDKVEFPGSKAILVSDVIECQRGTAHLRFHYWTSSEVKITVCVKSVLRLFPYFDYCVTPIENGDPGPAFLTLPELSEPMQIFIQAHNFVFNSAAIQGGFAIIDNLEYYGEFCDREGNSYDQFAAARNAPSQSVLRQQQLVAGEHPPLHAGGVHTASGTQTQMPPNSVAEQPGGPYHGFPSLLEWMLYGNGLARQGGTIRELLNATAPTVQMMETPPQVPQGTLPQPPPEMPPPQVPHQQELRSIRIVQKGPLRPLLVGKEPSAEDNRMERPANIGTADIRKSLLMLNGQRLLPHLELLARKKAAAAHVHAGAGRRIEEVEEQEEPPEGDDRAGEEEGVEEEEPNHVEREEWLGGAESKQRRMAQSLGIFE